MIRKTILALVAALVATIASAQVKSVMDKVPTDSLVNILRPDYIRLDRPIAVKSIVADGDRTIRVRLSSNADLLPLTRKMIATAQDSLRQWLGMPHARLEIMTGKTDLAAQASDDTTTCGMPPHAQPVVRQDEEAGRPLAGRNIALWPSHGRYYEPSLGRWEWQRGRLNTTVEDLLTPSIALPFLIPMLENAGAMVLTPRERDTTQTCVIVDDTETGFTATLAAKSKTKGFGKYSTLSGKTNPFALGNAQTFNMTDADSLTFRGVAPATGRMMVYVAYARTPEAAGPVSVTVRHAVGTTHYTLDQRMGGGMWMPLGMSAFREGGEWSVTIKGRGLVSADAVRIGGGMGTVERGGSISGMPAWAEGARYYLQTDGFDYAKVLSVSEGRNEYTDDINCRGEWVNSLVADKHIPIDMALALHTDAFVTMNDSVIGTLCIVSTSKRGGKLADGRSTLTSRQLAWHVLNALRMDIRRSWNTKWLFRGITDKSYSESRRPDVPTLLLELMSHQNVADISHALHPAFRRDAARSIYKGILRYLAGNDAAVSPLAPSRVGLRFEQGDTLSLHWSFTPDTLEPSAVAERYEVYQGERLIMTTSDTVAMVRQPLDGKIRTYWVVAIGPGGRSLPSEAVPACLWRNGRKALLVEGMDRLAAPATLRSPSWSGVLVGQDPGAPWHGDRYTTGEQYDFDTNNEWKDDDEPGCGASYADMECVAMAGSATMSGGPSGVAMCMRLEGYSFVGVTKSFFDADTSGQDTTRYAFVRINLDRQRTTSYGDAGFRHSIYTEGFRRHVESIIATGVTTVVSGSFVGSDIGDEATREWCAMTLGFKPRTGHATRTFRLTASPRWMRDNCLMGKRNDVWHQQADAIEPASPSAKTVCRYADSQMSAGVAYGNVIVMGL